MFIHPKIIRMNFLMNKQMKLSTEVIIPLDEKQPNNTFLDSKPYINPIPDIHITTANKTTNMTLQLPDKETNTIPDTCVL